MKFSPLAVVLLASTTLVSVTSAAVTGGIRGSIDQTQTRRSLRNLGRDDPKDAEKQQQGKDAAGMSIAADAGMSSMVSTAGANVAVVDGATRQKDLDVETKGQMPKLTDQLGKTSDEDDSDRRKADLAAKAAQQQEAATDRSKQANASQNENYTRKSERESETYQQASTSATREGHSLVGDITGP